MLYSQKSDDEVWHELISYDMTSHHMEWNACVVLLFYFIIILAER